MSAINNLLIPYLLFFLVSLIINKEIIFLSSIFVVYMGYIEN